MHLLAVSMTWTLQWLLGCSGEQSRQALTVPPQSRRRLTIRERPQEGDMTVTEFQTKAHEAITVCSERLDLLMEARKGLLEER